jgi:N-acetylmuramoyl-L-alanine amidase
MRKASGRGFDSRRLHHVFGMSVLVVMFAGSLLLPHALFGQERLTVFEGARKTEIALQSIEGLPYLKVSDLAPVFGLTITPIAGNQNASVRLGKHNIILSANRNLVSVDEKVVPLRQPAYVVQGEWYVPLDFISKALKATSEKRMLWLETSHSLILGDVVPNQLLLKYSPEQDHSRIVLQSIRPLEYDVARRNDEVIITPESEDFLPAFADTTFDDGILNRLSILGSNERKSFHVETAPGFGSYRSFVLSDPPRLVLDFYKRQADEENALTPKEAEAAKTAAPTLLPSVSSRQQVIVIDPGHGGSETGAAGPEGVYEKDLVLSIARKLKGMIESRIGARVILTRDDDRVVSLDDRTALANNNKADLFISIHANATVRGQARGAESYFLSTRATDDEARNLAAVENNAIGLNQDETANVGSDLKLILWDMAQTEYLAESSRLAEMIQQELNSALGIENRGIKQAPFRVLMGATMPAVLIEVGFINNPAEEKLLKDSEYQTKIARAIFRSIQRFQGTQIQQAIPQPESGRD